MCVQQQVVVTEIEECLFDGVVVVVQFLEIDVANRVWVDVDLVAVF